MADDNIQSRIDAVKVALREFSRSLNQPVPAAALVAALREADLPSTEIANLLACEVSTWGNATRITGTDILNSFIQIRLTKEHVEAQNKSSAAADRLSRTNNRLALGAVLFAAAQIVIALLQWHQCK